MRLIKACMTLLIILPYSVFAVTLGDVANKAQQPMYMASSFLESSCIIIGFGFIAFAYANYRRYRINPYEIRLSSIIVELILGIVLIILGSLRSLDKVF